jgi:O-acetyl-ADP-ribose deacetylase (regulator of RNase III)
MLVRVILVDVNPKMTKAWRATFEENPEVDVVDGSMLAQQVSAWVTPTNAKGSMDGGLDLVIKNHLGVQIEHRVQQEIKARYGGFLPVGHAVCVSTERPMPPHLISTPTMVASSEDVSDTLNVALACAAAFQMVHMQNARQPGSIRSVALPGLGANTGRVPVEICADLMWTAYDLFRRQEFTDFGEMRKALEQELGDLGSFGKQVKPGAGAAAKAAAAGAAAAAVDDDDEDDDDEFDEDDEDFDDHE